MFPIYCLKFECLQESFFNIEYCIKMALDNRVWAIPSTRPDKKRMTSNYTSFFFYFKCFTLKIHERSIGHFHSQHTKIPHDPNSETRDAVTMATDASRNFQHLLVYSCYQFVSGEEAWFNPSWQWKTFLKALKKCKQLEILDEFMKIYLDKKIVFSAYQQYSSNYI